MIFGQPDRVWLGEVPTGYPGTVAVVRLVGKAIRAGSGHPRIRARVRELLAGVKSGDLLGELAALWEWVISRVRFQRDPHGLEHITSPVELDRSAELGEAAEDCESLVAYLGALCVAAGLPVLIEIQGRRPGDRFRHAALAVGVSGRGLVLADPSAAILLGLLPGQSAAPAGAPVERWTIDGEKAGTMSKSLAAATLGDVDWQTTTRGVADTVANVAGGIGPYGALVAGLIKGGEAVYDLATGKPVAGGKLVAVKRPGGGSVIRLTQPARAAQKIIKAPPAAGASAPLSPALKVAGLGAGALLLAKIAGVL